MAARLMGLGNPTSETAAAAAALPREGTDHDWSARARFRDQLADRRAEAEFGAARAQPHRTRVWEAVVNDTGSVLGRVEVQQNDVSTSACRAAEALKLKAVSRMPAADRPPLVVEVKGGGVLDGWTDGEVAPAPPPSPKGAGVAGEYRTHEGRCWVWRADTREWVTPPGVSLRLRAYWLDVDGREITLREAPAST